MRQTTRLLLPALLLLAPAARPEEADAPKPPARPDIVLILVDSLRADRLGCNGYPKETSPVMDALAKEGANFTQAAASASWTQPSVMTLFTSVPPDIHLRVLPRWPHAEGLATLADTLKKAGYQTVGITANPMTHRRFGFAKGFESYDDYVAVPADDYGGLTLAQFDTCPTLTRLAEGWLKRRDPARPLFLFILYMDVHWDYQPPAPYYRMFTDDPIPAPKRIGSLDSAAVTPAERARILAAYDGEIRYTDTHIGQLLEAIKNSPRGRDTAVAVCADHGESFWERGILTHGNHLHEEEVRVPLIIRPPESAGLAKGVVVKEQVGLIDLAPTLLDLAGLAPPEAWQGRSLRPFFEGGTVPERPIVMDTRVKGGILRGARTSRYKVTAREPFTAFAEVYDLQADPGEKDNLANAPLPDAAAALLPLLKPKPREP